MTITILTSATNMRNSRLAQYMNSADATFKNDDLRHQLIAMTILVGLNHPAVAADVVSISRWTPHDFSFAADMAIANPFATELSAVVVGPSGTTFVLPGFFVGNGTWKVRIAPTVEGEWSLTTKSDVDALNEKTAVFTCVENPDANNHGLLRVDKTHPHHFAFEDGTCFFMQAYEYDWLWVLDAEKPNVPTVEASLDLLAEHGFNYVILNTYAHDTRRRKGKTGPDDFGPAPMFPWAGSNDSPDHACMNLDYWRHYDQVIDAILQRGMQAHIFIKVFNKAVAWPEKDSLEEQLFSRWLIARYSTYPKIIWDSSKEAHNEKDLAYKQRWLKYIRETDPYDHLVTVHDDDVANDSGAYDELTDMRIDQHHESQKGANDHETILKQRNRRAWPVANVESDFECGLKGLDDKTYGKAMTPEATTKTLWNIAMAGGYTGYYYTYTAWDVIRPLDKPTGYTYMKHFGDFWRGTEFWKLDPSDLLVNHGWCLAQPGKEYVVYQEQDQPFTLDIVGAGSTLSGEWFNAFTGQRTAAGEFENGTAKLSPPKEWPDAPLVLHLKSNATPNTKSPTRTPVGERNYAR